MEPGNQWDNIYSRQNLPWTQNPRPIEILKIFTSYFEQGNKILDYGGGDGYLSELLIGAGLDVACSDVSARALELAAERLPTLKTVKASGPSFFVEQGHIFNGILNWGVMHHVDHFEWKAYLVEFEKIIQPGGVMLLGGHSTKDREFSEGSRISPTTKIQSHAVDEVGEIAETVGFKILSEGIFEFTEAFSGSSRAFKFFFLQKITGP